MARQTTQSRLPLQISARALQPCGRIYLYLCHLFASDSAHYHSDKLRIMAVVQSLDARYIDGPKLLALLKNLFGTGNFSFDVSDDV